MKTKLALEQDWSATCWLTDCHLRYTPQAGARRLARLSLPPSRRPAAANVVSACRMSTGASSGRLQAFAVPRSRVTPCTRKAEPLNKVSVLSVIRRVSEGLLLGQPYPWRVPRSRVPPAHARSPQVQGKNPLLGRPYALAVPRFRVTPCTGKHTRGTGVTGAQTSGRGGSACFLWTTTGKCTHRLSHPPSGAFSPGPAKT